MTWTVLWVTNPSAKDIIALRGDAPAKAKAPHFHAGLRQKKFRLFRVQLPTPEPGNRLFWILVVALVTGTS